MRIAVLADIHGNVLALEAVLADLARQGGCDRLVNLGDCVSGPLWPRETLDVLTALDCVTVRGNHDRQVGTLDRATLLGSDAFAADALDEAQKAWLAGLPPTVEVGPGVAAVHGTARSDEEYLVERVADGRLVRDDPARIGARLGGLDATLILCGHSHRPDLVSVARRQILNPGSVGCPAYHDPGEPAHVSEAGSPLARYAIVETGEGLASASFRAVRYDHETAAAQAERQGRPDWGHVLRSGFCDAR